MRKIKIIITVMTLLALSVFSLNASAVSPALYGFQSWNGSGSSSVTVSGDSDTFVKLIYDGQEVDRSAYTVEAQDGKTVLTLTEEYLRSLNAENGSLFFEAYFCKENYEIENQNTAFDPAQNKVIIQSMPFEAASKDSFESFRLTYGGEEIAPSHYTLAMTDSETTVTFEEGFLDTLSGEKSFVSYSTYKQYTYFVSLKSDVIIEETPSQPDTDEPASDQIKSPQTGFDKNAVQPIIAVLMIAAVGIVVLAGVKYKWKEN